MLKKLWALPFVVLALNSEFAGAQSRSKRVEVAPVSSYDSGSSLSSARTAVGYRYYGSFGFLNGSYWLDQQSAVSFGLGASSDFDNIGFLATYRRDLYSSGSASMFAEGALSFVKRGAVKPFTLLAAFGFDYGLTQNLHASFGYGLGVAFGSGVTDHFATTQESFHGNFGIEWRF